MDPETLTNALCTAAAVPGDLRQALAEAAPAEVAALERLLRRVEEIRTARLLCPRGGLLRG